jgi:hypothetical protein
MAGEPAVKPAAPTHVVPAASAVRQFGCDGAGRDDGGADVIDGVIGRPACG